MLRCFVGKVSNVAISRFLVAFLAHFGTLCYFLELFGSFVPFTLFGPELDLS